MLDCLRLEPTDDSRILSLLGVTFGESIKAVGSAFPIALNVAEREKYHYFKRRIDEKKGKKRKRK